MSIDWIKLIELIKDPDLKIKITNLYSQNIKLSEENYQLRMNVQKLNDISKVTSELEYRNNHYFRGKEGPFCSGCWDAEKILIRLHEGSPGNGQRYFSCPNCKTNTYTGTYIQPEIKTFDWE